jgi:hypothetical protein
MSRLSLFRPIASSGTVTAGLDADSRQWVVPVGECANETEGPRLLIEPGVLFTFSLAFSYLFYSCHITVEVIFVLLELCTTSKSHNLGRGICEEKHGSDAS